MYRHIVGPKVLDPLCSGQNIIHRNHIHHNFCTIVLAGLDAFPDGRIAGCAKYVDDIGTCFGCSFDLGSAGIHDLHICDDGDVREKSPEFPDGMQTFTLDERRAGFEPVYAAGDSGLGAFQSPFQIYKI